MQMLGFFVVIIAAAPAILLAQEQTDGESDWKYAIAPYAWFISVDGDVTVKGQSNDVDVNFSDVWDEFNIGATIEFKAWKGRYGFFGNVIYGNVGKEKTVDGIRIDPTLKNLWTEFGGF
jgi:hypothetical protein